MRGIRATLAVIGWGILGLLALAGVALSALVLYASSPAGRRVVASALIRLADKEVAGSLKLDGVDLQPGGGIAIRGFEAFDPDGHLVLEVDRILVSADLRRLRNKVVGVDAELDGVAVLVDEDENGELSLARAFAPARPKSEEERRKEEREKKPFWENPLGGWTIRILRLAVRDSSVWWQDAAGRTRLEAQELEVDARALLGPKRGRAEISLKGQVSSPVPGALSVEVRALFDGPRLQIPILRARLGETELEALADADLAQRSGRAALTQATLASKEARSVVKGTPLGTDLSLGAYAEADGRIATAALRVEPRREGGAGGGDAAVAVRLDGSRALGFDVVARALDPSALYAGAPKGSLSLTAHGGFSGDSFSSARGNLDLSLSRSLVRGGELGPASAVARLDRGSWEVTRLSLVAPGVRLEGAGSFRQGGSASAHLEAEVGDLARAADNAGKLLGKELPRLSGRATVQADLTGTAAAPVLSARAAAPALAFERFSAAGVQAHVDASGPFRPGRLRVQANVDRLSSGGQLVARGLALDGGVAPVAGDPGAAAGTLSASGMVPSLGKEPVSLEAAGALPRDRQALRLSKLSLSYPGTTYALEAPATVTFAGPRVDRLALAAGPRRIAVEGGLGPKKALDARLEVVKLDLSRLPAGLLPADQRIAGEVTADARAAGTLARPRLEARVQVDGGGFRSEQGLGVKASLRYDGARRRAAGQLAVQRAGGGTVDLDADLPVPLRGRSAEPVSATLRASSLPVADILKLAGSAAPLSGSAGATVRLGGTAAAPSLTAQVTLAEGAFRNLQDIALDGTANLGAEAGVTTEIRLSGKPAVRLRASAPLSLAALLAEPGRALEGLRRSSLTADATLPGLDLGALAGKLGFPESLRGQLTGEVHAKGRPTAPRGTVNLTVAGGAYGDIAGIAGKVEATAGEDRVEARIQAGLDGRELLRLTAALRAPPEKLATRAGVESAPLLVDGVVPEVDLEPVGARSGTAMSGVVDAKFHAEGTPARPDLRLDGTGRSIHIAGRPVGEVRFAVRAAGDRATADLGLNPPAGGKLTANASVTLPISAGLRAAALREAPARIEARAEAVDLGFVPAILPSLVRAASGKLDADLTAAGPLARLIPRGTVRLAGGRLSSIQYGDYTGVALDAAVTEDAIELRTLEARRGDGSLRLFGALRGLASPSAQLSGSLEVKSLTLTRNGSTLGTVNVSAKASGTYRDRKLDARIDVPEGTVRLADSLPRELQSLDKRPDIVIGPKPPPKKEAVVKVAAGTEGNGPLTIAVRLVSPGKFHVQRARPRIQLEMKADVTYERQGGKDFMSGTVEVVRGFVEPLNDRHFDVKRGRLVFTGGPPQAAVIEAEALYQNPTADVTVTVSGPVSKPQINLRSQPPLEEAQIAMLIATGQTELRPGGAGVGGQNDLSRTAAQKLGFAVFNTFIREQLPFSTGDVSIDSSAARVSAYIPGTQIYVGYTRRFDANKQLGENEQEVRLEYAITPRWALEGRWGDANTGGASLIWSRDY